MPFPPLPLSLHCRCLSRRLSERDPHPPKINLKKVKKNELEKWPSKHHDSTINPPQIHHDLPRKKHPKTQNPMQKRQSTTP
jgi:hypothetical protein